MRLKGKYQLSSTLLDGLRLFARSAYDHASFTNHELKAVATCLEAATTVAQLHHAPLLSHHLAQGLPCAPPFSHTN